jgi:DNA-directed RNA polymerase I subunit RPA12
MQVASIVTKSAQTGNAPEWATLEEKEGEEGKKHATIEEPCPKCGHHEQYFYTMQLRSVDEGQTVFYECPTCAYKYSVNN